MFPNQRPILGIYAVEKPFAALLAGKNPPVGTSGSRGDRGPHFKFPDRLARLRIGRMKKSRRGAKEDLPAMGRGFRLVVGAPRKFIRENALAGGINECVERAFLP